MSDLHPTTFAEASPLAGGLESLAAAGHRTFEISLEPQAPPWTALPDEPASLTLALIGFVGLVAFRGLQKLATGKRQATDADRGLIKPRRRAA
jgi:hypothetical protein